jgi:hypothetical protein
VPINALAAASIWEPISVRVAKLLQIFARQDQPDDVFASLRGDRDRRVRRRYVSVIGDASSEGTRNGGQL